MTDDELAKAIGRNVRAARLAAGLSQGQLSERTGIAVPHISRLEAGSHLPSVATLKKVADTLEVPICGLIDAGKPAKPPAPPDARPGRGKAKGS